MARRRRSLLPGQPVHVIQRGNNRQAIFLSEADFALYRRWAGAAAASHGCAIHAYVLMTNHVHLLLTPQTESALPGMMQALGRRYVRYFNDLHGRTGTLWEGRYRAAPIDSETYFLTCARYIELNPVRAGLVARPGDWLWSRHAGTAGEAIDSLLTEHPLQTAPGASRAERRAAYRALFEEVPAAGEVEALRRSINGGWAVGGERFLRDLKATLGRPVTARPRGRPRTRVAAGGN